jgi:hypothetical protein
MVKIHAAFRNLQATTCRELSFWQPHRLENIHEFPQWQSCAETYKAITTIKQLQTDTFKYPSNRKVLDQQKRFCFNILWWRLQVRRLQLSSFFSFVQRKIGVQTWGSLQTCLMLGVACGSWTAGSRTAPTLLDAKELIALGIGVGDGGARVFCFYCLLAESFQWPVTVLGLEEYRWHGCKYENSYALNLQKRAARVGSIPTFGSEKEVTASSSGRLKLQPYLQLEAQMLTVPRCLSSTNQRKLWTIHLINTFAMRSNQETNGEQNKLWASIEPNLPESTWSCPFCFGSQGAVQALNFCGRRKDPTVEERSLGSPSAARGIWQCLAIGQQLRRRSRCEGLDHWDWTEDDWSEMGMGLEWMAG